MTEFALIMPFFLTMGLWGIELANYQFQIMKIEQIAANVADNGSRIGDYSTLQNRRIFESDIDDLLVGANLAAGTQMNLLTKGRIILSSLEVNSAGKQYIHWQRCVGSKAVASSYGKEGDVLGNAGIGPVGSQVPAVAGDAVMFVELQYDYQPLISARLIGNPTIKSIASYTVRSSRDLTQIYQTSPASPKMTCDKYTSSVA
jgi:hypothetical protein